MKLKSNFGERRSLGQDVFEYLKDAIISQAIEPGERLVESRIADMLGVSRTPLREALHKLEREDWIEKTPSGGYMVVSLTAEDIEQTFGVRSILEAYAARLAAENHADKDLIPLEKKLREFRECLGENNGDKLQKINTEFHDLLYALSGNTLLIRMISQVRSRILSFRRILLGRKSYAEKSNDDHTRMLEMIRKKDGEGVEQLVRRHIDQGGKAVLERFVKEENTLKKLNGQGPVS